MNASQSNDSTEEQTNNSFRINPDHILVTDVVSVSDVMDAPGQGIALLPPPLSTIETETATRRKGNAGIFKANNQVRKDSADIMKEFGTNRGQLRHPVNDPRIRKVLGQTNLRKIPAGNSELESLFRSTMIEFLTEKADSCCFSPRHNQYTKCTCLKELLQRNDRNIEAVSDIVTSYYQYGYKERFSLFSNKVFEIMDRKMSPRLKSVSNMKFRGRLFSLRGKFDSANENYIVETHNLCMYAYLCVYGIGPYHLDTVKSKYEMSSFDSERNLAHGLMGKKSNNAIREEVVFGLNQFFNELKEEGDDYASRQVRSHVGGTYLRDNEIIGVRLPPSYTKKGLYNRWCYSQGWVVNQGADTHKGYKSYRVRPFDDIDFPPGSNPSPICSRDSFMTYWKTNYPHIKIAPSSKDTCGKCWEFKRQIQSQDRRRMQASDVDDNNDRSAEDIATDLPICQMIDELERTEENDEDDNAVIAGDDTTITEITDTRTMNTECNQGSLANTDTRNGTDTVNSTDNDSNKYVELYSNTNSIVSTINSVSGSNLVDQENSDLNNHVADIQLTEQENIVSVWKQHCDDFSSQRRYVQTLSLDAKEDLKNAIPFSNRKFSYCSDYCQNMDLPHFGSEQPGETYYYSPLNISCFGVTDLSTDVLDSFIYHEGEGKKGGNNVCSLIFKKLKDDRLIDLSKIHGPAKQLSLVFDNCAGQNKNRMVLRLAQFLIDIKVFKRVEIIFLIMGHTKNICDRRFKDLKNKFHHRNVYTMKQLIEVLSTDNQEYVNVIKVDKNSFFNWDEFFTTKLSYKKAIKDCSKYHCFFYDNRQKGAVFKKNTVLNTTVTKETINKQYDNPTWNNSLSVLFPELEKVPGIADIKKVELYTKWRKLIPSQYQDEICPKPEDNVLLKVKAQKAKKTKAKLAAKKQQLNENNPN